MELYNSKLAGDLNLKISFHLICDSTCRKIEIILDAQDVH